MLAYAAGLGLRAWGCARQANVVWRLSLLAYLLYVLHVLAAFHFVHSWSHGEAWRHTAEQTAQLTGIGTGIGLWMNHLLTLAWGFDLLGPHGLGQKFWTRFHGGFDGFLAFMAFNGVIVFGPPATRWWGVMVLGALVCLLLIGRARANNSKSA